MDITTLISALLKTTAVVPFAKSLSKALYDKIDMLMLPSKEAEALLIEQFKNSDDPLPLKTVKIKHAKKLLKEWENQYDIYKIAQDELDTQPKQDHSEDVDAEWLSRFMDSSKHVCSDDVKLIWGKLLAEECTHPNSVPTRLINILSIMDRKLSLAFSTLCSLCLYDSRGNITPIIRSEDPFFRQLGLSFEMLSELDSIGLINFKGGEEFRLFVSNPSITKFEHTYIYNSTAYRLESETRDIVVTEVLMTDAGSALYRIIPKNYNVTFESMLPELLKNYSFTKIDHLSSK